MQLTAFHRRAFLASFLFVVAAFFVPLILISYFDAGLDDSNGAEEATVGIGVILRATARRLFRSGTSQVLRTSFAAYMRAATRALTRRTVKIASRVAVASITKGVTDVESDADGLAERGPYANLSAVVIGFLGLFGSFYGVLWVADETAASALTTDVGLSPAVAAALGACPLVVYAILNLIGGRIFGVRVYLQTALDGLLLQGYFTGAGSFLPMTTDVHYEGEVKSRAKAAGMALAGLLIVHLVLSAVARTTGSDLVALASTSFLIYCFVCSFPIKPLEGYELWRASKIAWLILWIPILTAFMMGLPEEFGAIL